MAVNFYHFNDVYNIEYPGPDQPGGASRFATVLSEARSRAPGPLFCSGDVFFPSMLSTVTRGAQMPPVMNMLDIDACCLGNHVRIKQMLQPLLLPHPHPSLHTH